MFLNQACAWFLKLLLSMIVCMYEYVSAPRLLLTSSMMWHDIPYDWLNKLYSFYVTVVVGIVSGCGLNTDVHNRNLKLWLKQINSFSAATIYCDMIYIVT